MDSDTTAAASPADRALAQRLRACAPFLLDRDAQPAPEADPAIEASVLLGTIVQQVYALQHPELVWLLYVAVSGSYPNAVELDAARRELELRDVVEYTVWLLSTVYPAGTAAGTAGREIEIAANTVLVDVQFSARNDLHTGIQRVVRHAIPEWRDKKFTLVAWNSAFTSYQHLTATERSRILSWGSVEQPGTAATPTSARLVVPWRSVVLLLEVPPPASNLRLAALATSSGNELAVVGYDCIPVVSTDLMPPGETDRFVNYLATIKHAHRIAAISDSSAAEFSGFASMLSTQGLAGPAVTSCSLPVEIDPAESRRQAPKTAVGQRPSVLCVGSFEPRKNQLGLLFAAEVLWREGLDFELHLIGGSGWGREFPERLRELRRAGRPVRVEHRVSDVTLEQAYARARFTVFASVHEGYGLPVAESLAAHTPVITSGHGSMAQIARDGGALTIDPRDDEALVAAMRDLLTDDALLARLTREIAERPRRTWGDYAEELWQQLVQPPVAGHPLPDTHVEPASVIA